MNAVIVVPVGPQPREVTRFRYLMESLLAWESRIESVLVIDDSVAERKLCSEFRAPQSIRVTSLKSPRLGKGEGLLGGGCEGLVTGFAHVLEHTRATFLVKLDTDALVVGPFVERIATLFERHPEAGMLGTAERECDGQPFSHAPWDEVTRKLAARVSIRLWQPRRGNLGEFVNVALVGARARVRDTILAARARGYRWGEHCLGGAYALHLDVLRNARRAGYLESPRDYRDLPLGEDVLGGIFTLAAGRRVMRANRIGEPFGCQYRGLPALPDEIVERGYALIHSVKNDDRLLEGQIRDYFSERRRSQARDA